MSRVSRNIFYVYKKYRLVPDAPADGQIFEDQLTGPIHLNAQGVEVYRVAAQQGEMPRAREWIPGADGTVYPLERSNLFG